MDTMSNPVVAWLEDGLDFVKKYKKQVTIGAIGVVALGAAITGYFLYRIQVRENAHKTLLHALRYYDGVIGKPSPAHPGTMFFESEHEKWQKTAQVFKDCYDRYGGTELAPMFLSFQSEALLNLGKRDDALALLRKAVGLIGNTALKDLYNIKVALMLIDGGVEAQTQDGVAILKKLADNEKSPAHEFALYHLGSYFWSEKKFADAKNYWQMLLIKYGTKDLKHPSVYAETVKEKLALVSVESL